MTLDPQKCVEFVEYFANHLAHLLGIEEYKNFFDMRTEEINEFFDNRSHCTNWGEVIDQLFELELIEDMMKPNFDIMIKNSFGELPVITWPAEKEETDENEHEDEHEPAD